MSRRGAVAAKAGRSNQPDGLERRPGLDVEADAVALLDGGDRPLAGPPGERRRKCEAGPDSRDTGEDEPSPPAITANAPIGQSLARAARVGLPIECAACRRARLGQNRPHRICGLGAGRPRIRPSTRAIVHQTAATIRVSVSLEPATAITVTVARTVAAPAASSTVIRSRSQNAIGATLFGQGFEHGHEPLGPGDGQVRGPGDLGRGFVGCHGDADRGLELAVLSESPQRRECVEVRAVVPAVEGRVDRSGGGVCGRRICLDQSGHGDALA